jgi:hypothetical protein
MRPWNDDLNDVKSLENDTSGSLVSDLRFFGALMPAVEGVGRRDVDGRFMMKSDLKY